MISTTRIVIAVRQPWPSRPETMWAAVGPAWADTLAELARSHRARLTAPDPSRPWLTSTDGAAPMDTEVSRSEPSSER